MKKIETDKETNELNVTVKKNGVIEYLNEDCCSAMTFLLKMNGDVACSYFGIQSDEVIALLGKIQKKYLKKIKKEFKLTKKQKQLRDDIHDFNKILDEQAKEDLGYAGSRKDLETIRAELAQKAKENREIQVIKDDNTKVDTNTPKASESKTQTKKSTSQKNATTKKTITKKSTVQNNSKKSQTSKKTKHKINI